MSGNQQVTRDLEVPTGERRVLSFPTTLARLHGWMAPVRGPGVAHLAVRNPTSAGWRLVSLCGSAAAGPYRGGEHARSRRRCRACLAALARLKVPAPQPPPGPASPPPGGRAA